MTIERERPGRRPNRRPEQRHTRGSGRNQGASSISPDASSEASLAERNDELLESSRPKKKAREKVMDYLARRGHSEQELRQKLSRTYELEEVEDAIRFAHENNWMTPPEELAERVAAELGRRKKGHRFINRFLKTKGLPPVTKDSEDELARAQELAETKLSRLLAKAGALDYEESRKIQQKIHRHLGSRGFDEDTIRRVLATLRATLKAAALDPE